MIWFFGYVIFSLLLLRPTGIYSVFHNSPVTPTVLWEGPWAYFSKVASLKESSRYYSRYAIGT